MTDDTEPGAEAGGESYIAQLEREQTEAEAPQEVAAAPIENAADPQADTPVDPAMQEPEQAESAKEPLTPEEYQERQKNLNAALREERTEKRQLRGELETLRAEIETLKQSQPQMFEQFSLDQQIAEMETYDWAAYAQMDPEAAHRDALRYQELVGKRDAYNQHQQQQQQQQQQQVLAQRVQQFQAATEQSEAEYAKAHPDYDAASDFLRDSLTQEANAQGYFGPQAETFVNNQILQIGFRVFASGKDVAEFAYNEAKRRGYMPPAPDIASIKAGAEAAKSISTLGTQSAGGDGGSFEETMSGLDGAAARSFWEKAKKARYA